MDPQAVGSLPSGKEDFKQVAAIGAAKILLRVVDDVPAFNAAQT